MRIRNCFVTAVIFVAIATASCGSDTTIVGYDRAEENFWRGFLADPSNTLPKRVLESEYLAPFVVDGTFVPPNASREADTKADRRLREFPADPLRVCWIQERVQRCFREVYGPLGDRARAGAREEGRHLRDSAIA